MEALTQHAALEGESERLGFTVGVLRIISGSAGMIWAAQKVQGHTAALRLNDREPLALQGHQNTAVERRHSFQESAVQSRRL